MTIQRMILAIVSIATLSLTALGQESGTVTGTVFDGLTGEVIRGAEVALVGTGLTARTDLDGKFVLDAPAGTYQLRATLEGYFPNELDALELRAGTQQQVDVVLVEEQVVNRTVNVTAPTVQAATEAAVLLERRSAPIVSDAISGEQISSNGDSDAAGAMSRVVGASLVDDKYLFVRGLGDRFMSSTQLNGSLLATTEPDKKVVPLDLFPANLVDSISLEKTFTPDRPGEFAGALVNIETVEFPSTATLTVSFSEGVNSLTTGKDFMNYPGGKYDWLGFGDSRRHLPAIIPQERVVRSSAFSNVGFTAAQLETFGESFEDIWNPEGSWNIPIQKAIPNQSISLLAGNTWGRLGVVYGMTYGNKFQNRQIDQNYYRIAQGEVTPWHSYDMNVSSDTVRLGNTLNVAYKVSDNHKILFKNFYTKDASDEARVFTGYNDDLATDVMNQRLRFVEEGIYSGQVAGEHFLSPVNALFQWRVAYNRADRDEPDIREALYILNQATQTFRFRDQSQSGMRQFIASSDKIWEPGLDFTKFFDIGGISGSLKGGGVYTHRDRWFDSRRFRFHELTTLGLDLTQDPESLFTPQYIGPNFELGEDTRATDHYLGEQTIKAGYGMVDVFLGGGWRVIGGLRVENSVQILDSFDLFSSASTPIETRLDDTDYLPSINIVYALTPRQNLRGAYTQTLSRPNFRELAPFDFTDVTGGQTVVGNPDLVRTRINNFDMRWEYFPGSTEVIAASFFYKDFNDPIETVLQPTAQIRKSFANAVGARNWGIETEVRKQLTELGPGFENFSVTGNYTYVDSNVDIGDIALSILTSTERPLAGQSRHVVNTSVEYTNPRWWGHTSRVLYNMVGRRITEVGALGLPDVYQESQHLLDFILQQSFTEDSPMELKFSVTNILDDEKRYTQGGQPYQVFHEGRTYSIGLSYRFF